MNAPCSGIRVLDCSRGDAGALAAMVLADFGADVIRVETADVDPIAGTGSYLLLNRGKRSIRLDLSDPADRVELMRQMPGVDVVVEDWGPGHAAGAGLDYETLAVLHPALVMCSITPFGSDGPFAQVMDDDWLVMAKAGIFRDQPGWEQDGTRPIYRSCPDGSYFAGLLAVQGILAALRARDLCGRGQLVETSKLQAITCRQNPQVRYILRDGEELPLDRAASTETVPDAINPLAHHRDPREVTLTGMLVECKDGRWIMHSLSEPHFFPAWIDAIGFEWIREDERLAGAPWSFPDDDAKVELVQLLKARMKEKTAAEWIDAYVANGNVCADVIQTTQEALRHPQVTETGLVVAIEDPRVGPMTQIGPLAKMPTAPAVATRPAPEPGEHTDEVRAATVTPISPPAPTMPNLSAPLEGVTIVEAAYYYATPFATALLAELGARVIKVEPMRGDPYRLLARGKGDPIASIGQNNMVRAMGGKESIGLDLKSEQGRKIMHQLVAQADLFVHSFRGRVPETLGIDEPTLRAVNPGLVYQYAASYGSDGPLRAQPAIDPVIAAFAGTTAYQTGAGNPPLRESGADPAAAAGHAAAMMLGLFAKHRTGQGQLLESAMIVSNIYLNYEEAFAYDGKAPRPPVDARQLGTGALHRLYECAPSKGGDSLPHGNPDPRWVMIAAESDREFVRLCDVLGLPDVASDTRFATRAERTARRSELEDLLAPAFATRRATEWQTLLQAAGVGCVVADAASHFAFLYEDPQAMTIEMVTPTEHPALGGRYFRYSPVLRFSATPSRATRFCELGEHSGALLEELGYDAAAIARLVDDGIVAGAQPFAAPVG